MTRSLLIALSAFFMFSCKKDTTPSWLEIPAINLATDEPVEGANSHAIEDAWVYMDGKALGVFELPCKIPILDEGKHAFIIYAGVKDNGISDTRVKYPFYNRYETSLTLVKGQTISLTPTVTYKNNLEFVLIEDFEAPGMYFETSLISQTDMVFLSESEAPEIVNYGFRCGAIYLNETDSLFKGQTSQFLDLPKNEDVYLEFDIMNSNTFVTSTIAQNSSDYIEHVPLAGVNAQPAETMVWKKMYVPLIENVSWEVYATSYEIYLLTYLDEEKTSASIYLDNIKVIRYQ